jgi:hypothetical protein
LSLPEILLPKPGEIPAFYGSRPSTVRFSKASSR